MDHHGPFSLPTVHLAYARVIQNHQLFLRIWFAVVYESTTKTFRICVHTYDMATMRSGRAVHCGSHCSIFAVVNRQCTCALVAASLQRIPDTLASSVPDLSLRYTWRVNSGATWCNITASSIDVYVCLFPSKSFSSPCMFVYNTRTAAAALRGITVNEACPWPQRAYRIAAVVYTDSYVELWWWASESDSSLLKFRKQHWIY